MSTLVPTDEFVSLATLAELCDKTEAELEALAQYGTDHGVWVKQPDWSWRLYKYMDVQQPWYT